MVAVTVLRDGKEQTLQVPLYEDADMKSISESSDVLFVLGIAARGFQIHQVNEAFYTAHPSEARLKSLGYTFLRCFHP